jgi:hypothetical protein
MKRWANLFVGREAEIETMRSARRRGTILPTPSAVWLELSRSLRGPQAPSISG